MKSLIVLGLLASGVASAQNYDTNYGSGTFSHLSYGDYDSAFGYNTMFYNTTGYYNSAFGAYALYENSTGSFNTVLGLEAAYNTITSQNTALGTEALYSNQTGTNNIAIGYYAGGTPLAGNYNIEIGNFGLAKDNKVIRIGTQGTQTFTQIAGIYDSKVINGRAVVVDSHGHLGYAVTKVVPNVASSPATTADVLSLRQEIAALHNEVYALKAQVAAKVR